jgi:hypothetical protein
MDDKVKLALKQPKIEEIEYQGNTIRVKPYLSKTEQDELIIEYLKQYSDGSPIDAEYFLLFAVLELCTNIQLFDDPEQTTTSFGIDEMLSNWDLIEKIKFRIQNYDDFYARLQMIVNKVTIEKNSLSNIVQDGYTKILELINSLPEILSNLKISDEDMARVKEIVESPVLNEASKIFRQKEVQTIPESPSPTPNKTPKTPNKRTRKSK